MPNLNNTPILKSLDSNHEFNLDKYKNIFIIGKKRSADIKLKDINKDINIEEEHARLTRDLCGIKLKPLNGVTKINNQEIKEIVALNNSDMVTFGSLNYIFFEDKKNINNPQKNKKLYLKISITEKIFLISVIINLFLLCLIIPIITNSIINF